MSEKPVRVSVMDGIKFGLGFMLVHLFASTFIYIGMLVAIGALVD